MIKNIWAKISYYFFVGMLLIVGFLCGGLKVDAQEINSWSVNQVKINTCDGNGNCTDSSNANGNQTYSGSSLSYPLNFVQWRLKSSTGLSKENYYTLTFGYKPTPDAIAVRIQPNFKKTGDYEDENASCSQKYSDGWYLWTCSFEPRENYSSDEYLYVRITFYQDYLTKFQTRMDGFKVMRGVSGTIIDQTNIINSTIQNQTDAINDVNDSINDDDVSDPSSSISEFEDLLPSNGVITDLISMPIRFFSSIAFRVNRTCTAYSLPFLNDTTLSLPCINIQNYLGSTIWGLIDCILTGLLVYHIGKRFISIFENFTSMKDGDVVSND